MSNEDRFWMPNWMLGADFFKDLSAADWRVLLLLARMSDDIGVTSLLPSDLVAEVVGVPVEDVPQILASLVSAGALEKPKDDTDESRIRAEGKEGG